MQRSTSRLILRPPRADDLACVFAIHSDPETNQYNPAGPMTDISQAASMLDDWLSHWREKGFGQWAIATRDCPQQVIGFGGLSMRMYLDVERLNLGYRFAVSGWGQGYATELSLSALDYGFDELNAAAVFAVVRPAHMASIRVLEKIGMQRIESIDDVPGQPPSRVYKATRA
ncbi:GNAT family N-acetyltransferase [Pseudomonas huanghezhanensis]|uniref:GNAT family N-acetyltransferase n=1 Tax=Pseudomonas huanghezhanensis TaxID=3002903 RepID=UPI00228629C1|nr:GNAT family N-acetyltransferase [Pseudomonas sp. BSw22131]